MTPSDDDRDDDVLARARLDPALAAAFDTVRSIMGAFDSLGVGPPDAQDAPGPADEADGSPRRSGEPERS